MSNLPTKTDMPEYVDVEFANTLDLHIACSDMLTHLDDHANQQALILMWNATKHAPDPIQAQADFFNKLNEGVLDVKENSRVSASHIEYTPRRDDVNYFEKLDAQLIPNETWIYADDGNIETNEKGEYHALNVVTGSDYFINYNGTPDADVEHYLESLSEQYGAKDLDENFLLFWIEKFQRSHKEVKSIVNSSGTLNKENAFREFSDSIGLITRVHDAIDDRMIPFIEPYYQLIKRNIGDEQVEAYPSTANSILNSKLDKGTKFLQVDMAVKAGHIFRRNMQVMKKTGFGNPQLSTNAHGTDLVTDWRYLSHMSNALVTDLNGTIANNFLPALTKLLTFLQLQNENNIQKVSNNVFEIVVENSIQRVDLLMNKMKVINKGITNDQVLKSESVDLSDDS